VSSSSSARLRIWLLPLTCVFIACTYWYWAARIYAPANSAVAVASGRPLGNNSDLYPRWLGTRELLLHGRNPYSSDVTRDIQIGFYGRPLDPRNPLDPIAQQSFVYPLYTFLLLAPTASWPFPLVVLVFQWLLLSAIALSVPLWMEALGVCARPAVRLSAMLLAISSAPAVWEYFQQNLTALIVFFLAAAAAAVYRNRLGLAGALLAIATMKPDVTTLMIVWFLLWAASAWNHRSRLIWSFAATLMALVLIAEAFSPGWIGNFFVALREYPSYGTGPSILEVLLPSSLAKLLSLLVLFSLAGICWRRRHAIPGSVEFGTALAWGATATLVVIPKLAAYNEVLLIPAVGFLAAQSRQISGLGLFPRALLKATFACLLWPWITAPLLAIRPIWFSATNGVAATRVPDYTSAALAPMMLLALIAISSATRGDRKNNPCPKVRG
jgi:hypothetical protein